MTLTLDLPEDIAARLAKLPEGERNRRAAAAFRAFDAQEESDQPLAPGERSLADEILEILGPGFEFDPNKKGTRNTALLEGFPFMDEHGKTTR